MRGKLPAVTAALLVLVSACSVGETQENALWLAVGDSYMSGDGNPVAKTGSAVVWSLSDESAAECRRSDESGVGKAFREESLNLSCSGATMSEIAADGGQLDKAFEVAERGAKTNLIIGAGGNDIKWADILVECVTTNCVGSKRMTASAQTARETIPKLTDVIADRVERTGRFTETWVVTYPNFAYRDRETPCSSSRDPLYNRVTQQEWREMWEKTGSVLNKVLRSAAAKHGWSVVELEDAFYGHSVCDREPYVNGTDGMTLTGFAHPNNAGYSKISEIIREKTRTE